MVRECIRMDSALASSMKPSTSASVLSAYWFMGCNNRSSGRRVSGCDCRLDSARIEFWGERMSCEMNRSVSSRWRLDLRSEEHTSELQSLIRISYAVFCLKKTHTTNYKEHIHNMLLYRCLLIHLFIRMWIIVC